MELDKVIKDLEGMKKAGFVTCNIQCFLDQLEKVTESVVVDKFIADWYEKHKDCLDYYIWEWNRLNCVKETEEGRKFYLWLNDASNKPVETLVKMKLFGYKVKEELKYNVKVVETKQILYKSDEGAKFVDIYNTTQHKKYEFTKDELTRYGMAYVFNNKGFKVEEVE
jgi:gp178